MPVYTAEEFIASGRKDNNLADKICNVQASAVILLEAGNITRNSLDVINEISYFRKYGKWEHDTPAWFSMALSHSPGAFHEDIFLEVLQTTTALLGLCAQMNWALFMESMEVIKGLTKDTPVISIPDDVIAAYRSVVKNYGGN